MTSSLIYLEAEVVGYLVSSQDVVDRLVSLTHWKLPITSYYSQKCYILKLALHGISRDRK